MKHFHHYFIFSDPTGAVQSPHKFCDELMEPHGVTRIPALMHGRLFADDDPDGNGPIDEDKFRRNLSNRTWIPQDSKCWLNIENPAHNVYGPPQGNPMGSGWPRQEGIDFFHHVLDVAVNERPDVKIGIFGQVPYAGYSFVLDPYLQESRERLQVACQPLAGRLGFLLPFFYDRKIHPRVINTFAHRLRWIRTVLEDARKFFPNTLIFGMPWCEYYDLWKERPDPDTAEAQKARQLTGYTWHMYNKLILELADGVMWWGGDNSGGNSGTTHWDPDAEWWLASRGLLKGASA